MIMKIRKSGRNTTFCISILCLVLGIALVSGCGKEVESTLPPVTEDVKRNNDSADQETTAAADSNEQEASAWVIKDLINVRSKPSTTSDVVTQLTRGSEVKLVEFADKWWKVQLGDGRTAYIFENLLSKERYVDPWTRFKFEAGKYNESLKIITSVIGIDFEVPSAALGVSRDEWNSLTADEQRAIAESAFNFWTECLKKCGYDPQKSIIVFRDASDKELARANYSGGKTTVTLAN